MGFFDLSQAAGAILRREAPGVDRLADKGAIWIAAVRRGNGPPDRFLIRLDKWFQSETGLHQNWMRDRKNERMWSRNRLCSDWSNSGSANSA